jgi:hypothetical protein
LTDDTLLTEIPAYDTCQPCEVLKPVSTTIGKGYGCPVCQMTYIRVDKGAFIPFDQAMRLHSEKIKLAEKRAKRQQRLVARPPKRKKKRRR